MPWIVRFKRRDGQPIGTVDELREKMTQALPGLGFYRDPSGPERLAAYAKRGLKVPDVMLRNLEKMPAQLQADFESEDVMLRFYFGPEGSPFGNRIDIEARGTGNPIPYLLDLAKGIDCILVDHKGNEVEVVDDEAPAWKRFQDYVDKWTGGTRDAD